MTRYAVAAAEARPGTDRPVRPWHAADLLDDDPRLHAGEAVVSLCGVAGLVVFPLGWAGLPASQGCPDCRARAGLGSAAPAGLG